MKNLVLVIVLVILSPPSISIDYIEPVEHCIELEEVVLETVKSKNQIDFLHEIGSRESSNRYHIVNTLGYLGKYQFGMSTLKTLKIKTTKEEFLKNPALQEYAMQKLLQRNKMLLSNIITEYSGTIIDSIYITESGILAAAHLGGAGSVKKFFIAQVNKSDSYGTSVSNYMKDFSGYRLELN